MTDNELMAGNILRTSLSEVSNLILTNYLKQYQPETLEVVFSYLENDFGDRGGRSLKKYHECDNNRYKHDYFFWDEEKINVGKAREFYEEMVEEYPNLNGVVAFRYKYPSQRVEKNGDELHLHDQLLKLSKLCDELEELAERFKILFLPAVDPTYAEDFEYLWKYTNLKSKYEDLWEDISSNREIERSSGWIGLSIAEQNQYIDNKIEQLERKITFLEEELEEEIKEYSQGE